MEEQDGSTIEHMSRVSVVSNRSMPREAVFDEVVEDGGARRVDHTTIGSGRRKVVLKDKCA